MKLENEHQYRISCKWREKFKEDLWKMELCLASIQGVLQVLERDIAEYERVSNKEDK